MNVELDRDRDLKRICEKISAYSEVLESLAAIKLSPEFLRQLADRLKDMPISTETAAALLGCTTKEGRSISDRHPQVIQVL